MGNLFKKIGEFVLSNPINAAGSVILCIALPEFLPFFWPLYILSNAIIALVVLRHGIKIGVEVLFISNIALAIYGFMQTQSIIYGALYSLPMIAVFIYATALHKTISLPLGLIYGSVFGAACLLIAHIVVPNIDGQWLSFLNEHIQPLFLQLGFDSARLEKVLPIAAEIMTGSYIAAILIWTTITLLVARWWQALLYKPKGFKQEFYELRLGYVSSIIYLLILSASLLAKEPLLKELSLIFGVMFIFQGLSLAHNVLSRSIIATMWLGLMYFFLLISTAIVVILLVVTALIDNFIDIRSRLKTT